MHPNIKATLDRADKFIADLRREYDDCLTRKEVTSSVLDLTHIVCERLRSVLDRLANRYWQLHISPSLTADQRKRAKVYFPVTRDEQSFKSVMGMWKCQDIATTHAELQTFLLSKQAFSDAAFANLPILGDLTNAGKHVDLVPQVEHQQITRIEVIGPTGRSASYNPSKTSFGSNVTLVGAPIDPATQRIVPTAGVEERLEIWVKFLIKDFDVDGLVFCATSSSLIRQLAEDMSAKFGLS